MPEGRKRFVGSVVIHGQLRYNARTRRRDGAGAIVWVGSDIFMKTKVWFTGWAIAMMLGTGLGAPAAAQGGPIAAPVMAGPTYADLADLADPAEAVLRVQIRKQAVLEPARSPGLAPGHVRLYVEARTVTLFKAPGPVGAAVRYLVDLPRLANGKPPKLKKQDVVLFTRAAQGRPGELALVRPDAQLAWTPELEARLRPLLAELARADAPPAITGVREALSVQGNLVGESETQFFLSTARRDLVSISVVRRPAMPAVWGVAWDEIVDQAASPPPADTIEWYRLACFLPETLPPRANISTDSQARARAELDYRYVLAALGPCPRNRS